MLTLNDGRNELWQWDTNRKLTVDTECSQVHFSNKVFGRSVDVDVVDGVASIPDILLQTDKELTAWAFVGTAENGYTKISKVFKVNKRNKPSDYAFTPTDQTTLDEILNRIEDLERRPSGDVSKEDIQDAVNDYLDKNPISVAEKDPTVPDWAKQTSKPKYTAKEVGAVATVNGTSPDENGNVQIKVPDSVEGAVLYTEQTLTEEQKAQARENVGAVSDEEWFEIADITSTEEVNSFYVNKDKNGNPFVCKRIMAIMILPSELASGGDGVFFGGCDGLWGSPGFMVNNAKSYLARIYDISVTPGFFTEFRIAANIAKHFGGASYYGARDGEGYTDLLTQFFVCRGEIGDLYPVGTQLKVWGLKA